MTYAKNVPEAKTMVSGSVSSGVLKCSTKQTIIVIYKKKTTIIFNRSTGMSHRIQHQGQQRNYNSIFSTKQTEQNLKQNILITNSSNLNIVDFAEAFIFSILIYTFALNLDLFETHTHTHQKSLFFAKNHCGNKIHLEGL